MGKSPAANLDRQTTRTEYGSAGSRVSVLNVCLATIHFDCDFNGFMHIDSCDQDKKLD